MKQRIVSFVVFAFGIPAYLFGWNAVVDLASQASDAAVLCAWILGVLLAAIGIAGIAYVARRVKIPAALSIAVFALVALTNTGCNKVVEPGHVGLLVKQTGSERGVQDYPIQTGRVFYNPLNQDVLVWPTYVQRAIWTRSKTEGGETNEEISFQSKEGLHFTTDVNISYELEREKVPHFYVRFRSSDMDAFTHGFLRDAVRNSLGAASTDYTAEEINGSKQAELIEHAVARVKELVEPIGVHIIQLGFSAPPRPPDTVKDAIESKIAAVQDAEKIENQKRASIAEGEKVKAMAAATAEANRLINASLTPALVQWRQMDILQQKWDGKMPMVHGSGSGMILDLGGLGGK